MKGWDGLEEVVAVADAGTFVRGADLLNVSTSHISRAIARLEESLGAQLFKRTTRRVTLTDTGRMFVEHARRIIQARDDLVAQVNGFSEPQGDLRITCSIGLGDRIIAPLTRELAMRYPRLSVTFDLTNRIVDLVGEGYDIAIRTGQVSDTRLASRKIATRSMETCASPEYLSKAGLPTSIEDLEHHQCLVGTSSIWHFTRSGRQHIFKPKGRWNCNSGAAVADAAIAGMGVCHLPTFYVREHLESGRLEPVLRQHRCNPEPIYVVYPQRSHLLPKIRVFVDHLEQGLRDEL